MAKSTLSQSAFNNVGSATPLGKKQIARRTKIDENVEKEVTVSDVSHLRSLELVQSAPFLATR